ncbi:MAG: VOC family protein [Deltaproteobacteria bacterium]|nr:VOC family protein [Deltaproteobacteria bacterium]
MKVNKIDHISIAVKNLDEAQKIWEAILGKSEPDDTYVDELEKIRVARYLLGEVGFELMESTTPEGDVAKFIKKRGEGVMVISLNVDNTREAMDELKAKDYPFIGGARPFKDCEFAFIHPKAVNGLIDYKWD